MQYITTHYKNDSQKEFTHIGLKSQIEVRSLSEQTLRLSSVLNMVGGAMKPSMLARPRTIGEWKP